MIYFLDNSLQLQKIVTSKNINSAVHEHELNGLIRGDIELDLSYANKFLVLGIDHVGYYYKDEFYLHKIQRVEYDHVNETVLVVLRHVFFEDMIFGKLIQDVRPQNQDALFVLNQTIDANTRWQTVMTDVTGRLSTNFYWQVPYEVIEFVTENYRVEYIPKILFDGQKINGFQLHVANKVGEDKNIRIPFGSRVLDLKYEEDYSEIITKLVGHGKGEEVGDGYGRRINIADVNFSKNGVESPLGDVYMEDETVTATYGNDGQTPREGRVIFEDIENVNELAQATYEHYLQVSRPQMLFTADVADIGDVGIGDSVMIIRREYDVYFKARIHKLTVDLLYPEDAQVELGDYEHFKESKISRKSREKNNRLHKRNQSLIEQAKRDFDERFNSAVEQFRSEFEQAKIDIFAEIEADRERMENLLDTKSAEWTENFNQSVAESKVYAEQQAQEKASAVQSNLDSFKGSHQQLYDEVTGNILDIDTFLGDKSKTLKQQFDKVRTDFGTLQTDLDGVESDLTATKTDLQKQLDAARADLDGLEVGGRNLLPAFTSERWSGFIPNSKTVEMPNPYELIFKAGSNPVARIDLTLEPNTNYTMTFNSDHQRYYIYRKENGELTTIVRTITEGSDVFTFNTEDTTEFQLMFNSWSQRVDRDRHVWKPKLEKGTIATDWTPAPEDTEQKITTLNQQIEFIDGQLSAKLEQTDLLPINNKITEYGNSLTANAQSIESLISKTELHDGDITKWSNQTTANAESITSALSRISNTESGLTKAQTDIGINADGLSAVVNRVNKAETGIESLTTDFNIEAGKVETLINKTDGHASQLTNIVADYEKIEQTVAKNDDWLGTHGSNLLQTVDGFEQKVWMDDVQNIGANLIPFSDTQNQAIMIENWEFLSDGGSTFYTGVTSSNFFTLRNTRSGTNLRMKSRLFDRLVAGKEYTLSFLIQRTSGVNSNYNYTWINRPSGVGNLHLGSPTRITNNNDGTYTHEYVFTSDYTGKVGVSIGSYTSSGQDLWLRIKEPKLERGTKRTPYMTAFSVVEQRAEELSLRVQELSSINGEELITQSDISILPDRVLIGSQNIGAIDMASILSVSPSAIDMITDKLNLTGNLNVKGQIESLAVSAVRGDIAYLKTNILTANSITSEHLSVSTAMVHKLFAASARIDELITKSHFVNNVKAMSIEAVEGQFSSLMTKYLNANYIDVDYINGKNAWFESQYTLNANIAKLTAQHAFIRDVQAIEITANQLNIQTLHSKLKSVEGGLTIYGPDGRVLINNSILRASFDVQVYDYYSGSLADFNGSNFHTTSSFWQTIKYFYTDFKGSQLLVSWAMGLQTGNSASEYAEVQVRGFGGNNPIGSRSSRQLVKVGETTYHNQTISLGVPDYSTIQGYLEIRRSPGGTHIDNRITARILRISLIN